MGTLGGNSKSLKNSDFNFFDHVIPALQKAGNNNFLNIIITNQSHIAHGRIPYDEYNESLGELLNELEENGIDIAQVYTCPHSRKDNCDCKKPKPLFINEAIDKFDLDPLQCFVVGDSGKNDMMLANNVHMNLVLVLTGEGMDSLSINRDLWSDVNLTHIAEDSLDAINRIIQYE